MNKPTVGSQCDQCGYYFGEKDRSYIDEMKDGHHKIICTYCASHGKAQDKHNTISEQYRLSNGHSPLPTRGK